MPHCALCKTFVHPSQLAEAELHGFPIFCGPCVRSEGFFSKPGSDDEPPSPEREVRPPSCGECSVVRYDDVSIGFTLEPAPPERETATLTLKAGGRTWRVTLQEVRE